MVQTGERPFVLGFGYLAEEGRFTPLPFLLCPLPRLPLQREGGKKSKELEEPWGQIRRMELKYGGVFVTRHNGDEDEKGPRAAIF